MKIHNELNGFSGQPTKSKQITMQDLKNKEHEEIGNVIMCIGFDYDVYVDVGTDKPVQQRFHFQREGEKVWQVVCIIGNGETYGDVPLRIMYEIPTRDFDLVKVAAMGLMYIKLTLQERVAFYESLNYELVEVTNGI